MIIGGIIISSNKNQSMKNQLVLAVLFILLCSFTSSEPKIKIFIAGDSTAQSYKEKKDGLIKGWGQMLDKYFTDDVQVINHAMGGRSTKTFISEGRWDRLLSEVKAGDYVFIQFGHNDASTRPERHASYEDYEKNLLRFIHDVRVKDAYPVLLTSVVMRTFKEGNLVDDRLKGYPVIARKVAREQAVPMIDVNLKTRDFITMLGDSASIPYYRWVEAGVDHAKPDGLKDDTHMMDKGATKVASFIAEGVRELNLYGLSKYLKAVEE